MRTMTTATTEAGTNSLAPAVSRVRPARPPKRARRVRATTTATRTKARTTITATVGAVEAVAVRATTTRAASEVTDTSPLTRARSARLSWSGHPFRHHRP